jgi:hypothetical protein
VIAVLVRKQNAIELLRCHGAMLQTQRQLSCAQTAIDQKLAMIGRDQRTVSRAPAPEHRQAEHGFQGNRVISICANGKDESDPPSLRLRRGRRSTNVENPPCNIAVSKNYLPRLRMRFFRAQLIQRNILKRQRLVLPI